MNLFCKNLFHFLNSDKCIYEGTEFLNTVLEEKECHHDNLIWFIFMTFWKCCLVVASCFKQFDSLIFY